MEVVVLVLLIVFPVVGAVARRWYALLFPLVAWPVCYVGLDRGWWGDGTGDGWQLVAAALTAVGVATTAVAIAAARGLTRGPARRATAR